MRKYLKIILVQVIVPIIGFSIAHAEDNLSLTDFPNYTVSESSEIYPMIESAYVDIFKSKLNSSLCMSIGNVINIKITLGLKAEKSLELAALCKQSNSNLYKFFNRKYTVIFDPERKISFDSWTNLTGMTYLIFDEQVSYEKLKMMLIHELAIFLDGKSKMLYTGFVRHQNQNGIPYININDKKVKAFNFASRDDFSHAFASMRASAVEKFYLTQKLPKIMSTAECSSEFGKQVEYIRKNKSSNFVKQSTDQKLGGLIDLIDGAGSENLNDSNFDEHFQLMIDPKLILNDSVLGQVTFCQYMSYPMFSDQAYYSMFSNGPRPRTGGGWGDEGGGDASALVRKDLMNSEK